MITSHHHDILCFIWFVKWCYSFYYKNLTSEDICVSTLSFPFISYSSHKIEFGAIISLPWVPILWILYFIWLWVTEWSKENTRHWGKTHPRGKEEMKLELQAGGDASCSQRPARTPHNSLGIGQSVQSSTWTRTKTDRILGHETNPRKGSKSYKVCPFPTMKII